MEKTTSRHFLDQGNVHHHTKMRFGPIIKYLLKSLLPGKHGAGGVTLLLLLICGCCCCYKRRPDRKVITFGQQASNVNVKNVHVNSQVQTQVHFKRQLNGVVWLEGRSVALFTDIFFDNDSSEKWHWFGIKHSLFIFIIIQRFKTSNNW